MARCIALDIDCAQVCALAAAAMARGSEHAKAICMLCANICEVCGAECAHHAKHGMAWHGMAWRIVRRAPKRVLRVLASAARWPAWLE